MQIKFNIQQIPQYTVSCRTLFHAIDLKTRLAHVEKYAYKIWTITNDREYIFKYGESTQEAAERGYRQVWRFPGWPTAPGAKSSGDDFDWVVEQFPGVHKDDVYITVYDLTALEAINPLTPSRETKALEAQLIEEYYNVYGVAPIGNRSENSRINRGLVPTNVKQTPIYNILESFMDFK